MKKITALLLVLVTSFSLFTVNVSAFGGYMHWTIASIITELGDSSSISDDEKLAYKSGCLLADVGAVLMDGYKDISTDSYEFTRKLYDLAMSENSELSKAFAFGWRDHYIQDTTGNANYLYNPNNFGPYDRDNYHKNYGWIDEYLRDELQPVDDYPIQNNSISQMYVNYDLIQDTYEALGVSAPFKTTINANIILMCVAYDFFILQNTINEWTLDQQSRISLEILSMAGNSYGFNRGFPSRSLSNAIVNSENQISEFTHTINLMTDKEKKEMLQYFNVESTFISEGEAILTITKNNADNYNAALNRIIAEKMTAVVENDIK